MCFPRHTGAATRSHADAERPRVAHAVRLRPEVMKGLFFVWLLYHRAGNFAEADEFGCCTAPKASLVQREVGPQDPEGLCFSCSTSLVRFGKRAFSVTFDCPKVTKGHRGHFKPSPGPPGEGVSGLWCAFPDIWGPRPEAPLTRNGFGSLTQLVCVRKL